MLNIKVSLFLQSIKNDFTLTQLCSIIVFLIALEQSLKQFL